MGIRKRVSEAYKKLLENDPEEALFQICSAIEKTAVSEGRPKGKKGYKAFLRDNMHIITGFGFGHPIRGLRLHYTHPEIKSYPDGSTDIEDIIYHAFRCGYYHEADIPNDIQFTEYEIGGPEKGKIKLPWHIILGLVMAVVASPANSTESCDPTYCVLFNDKMFFMNKWWGRANELRHRLLQLTAPTAST